MDVSLHNGQYATPAFDDSSLVPGLEPAAGSSNRIKDTPNFSWGYLLFFDFYIKQSKTVIFLCFHFKPVFQLADHA